MVAFRYYQITCKTCGARYWQNKELVDEFYFPHCYKDKEHKDLDVKLLTNIEFEEALKKKNNS